MTRYHSETIPIPLPGQLRRELRLRRPPWWLLAGAVGMILLAVVPLAMILRVRGTLSGRPRVHLIQDMDVQPRYGPQAASAVFADGRAMRLPVAGTVARGSPSPDDPFQTGYEIRTAAGGQQELQFLPGLPRAVADDPRLLERGRMSFEIYCATCHGTTGDGHGPVNERAVRNQEPKWVPASSLLSDSVRDRPDGHLYNTIRNGIRSMPPYASQIPARQRWAIVAWVRELQKASVPATRPTTRASDLIQAPTSAAPTSGR